MVQIWNRFITYHPTIRELILKYWPFLKTTIGYDFGSEYPDEADAGIITKRLGGKIWLMGVKTMGKI